jgi:hypothetical protein
MTDILGTLAERSSHFAPSTPDQYIALQIARRLSALDSLRHYLVLFEHYPDELLLQVFRKCNAEARLSGEAFMQTLRELTMQNS